MANINAGADFVWCAGVKFYTMDLFSLLNKYVKFVEEAAGTDYIPTMFADERKTFTKAEWSLLSAISTGRVREAHPHT